MLLVITSAGSTLSRAVCQSPARSFSLSCTTPHVTPVNSLWGLRLWHGHNLKPQKHQALNSPTSPGERNRGGGLQRGKRGLEERSGRKSLAEIHSLFHQEVECLENRPCPQPPAPRLESPLLVSLRGSRAVKLARSLLRTPLPFPCQSLGAAATLPLRDRAGDRHPVSPP